ncbi:hypothetical protein N9273_00300 [bacterium]|nr:hypothetical protein [bacterium]
MAEDNTNTNPFASMMGALTSNKVKGKKGVRENSPPGKVSSTLSAAEKTRYTSIFNIMKDVMEPTGPKARKIGDEKPKPSLGTAGKGKQIKEITSQKGLGSKGLIAGLVGLAAGVGVLINKIMEDLEMSFTEVIAGIADFGSEVALGIGSLPAAVLKLAKFFPLKMLKKIPLLGSLISFGMAYGHFKKGEIFEGMWELTSGVASLFPGIGTAISIGMDLIKMMYDSTATVDPDTGEKQGMGSWLLDMGKKIGAWLWQKVKDGNVPLFSPLYFLWEGGKMIVNGDFKGGLKKIMYGAFTVFGLGPKQVDAISGMINTFMGSEKGQKIKEGLSSAGSWISDIFAKMGEGITSFFSKIKDWVDGKIEDGINKVKSFFGFGGDEETESPSSAERIQKWQEQKRSNAEDSRRRDIAKKANPEEFRRLYRRMVELQTTPGKKEERLRALDNYRAFINANQGVEDGLIYNNGKVTRFDDRDDILAAKTGGPIDKLLNDNSEIMASLHTVNERQLNVLVQIRDGINAMSGNSSDITTLSVPPNKLTEEFYAV